MPELQDEFVVATSFRLPGLGLLVLPAFPTPTWLADYTLHTALALTLLLGDQPPIALVGTIEELARDDQPAQRAILLDFAPEGVLLPGTSLQVSTKMPMF